MYEITLAEHPAYRVPFLEFRGTPLGFYRPLFMSAIWLTHTATGPSPLAFHLLSLLILLSMK